MDGSVVSSIDRYTLHMRARAAREAASRARLKMIRDLRSPGPGPSAGQIANLRELALAEARAMSDYLQSFFHEE